MKRSFKVMAMLVVTLLLASSAFAASPWTTEPTYGKKVAAKLDFGLKNLLGGWTEIFTYPANCPMDTDKKYCPIKCTKKVLLGAGNAVVYTLGGIVHTATFLIPVDVPLPNNGVQL